MCRGCRKRTLGGDGIHATMLATLELPPGYSTVRWLQQLAPGSPDAESLALLGWVSGHTAVVPSRCKHVGG